MRHAAPGSLGATPARGCSACAEGGGHQRQAGCATVPLPPTPASTPCGWRARARHPGRRGRAVAAHLLVLERRGREAGVLIADSGGLGKKRKADRGGRVLGRLRRVCLVWTRVCGHRCEATEASSAVVAEMAK